MAQKQDVPEERISLPEGVGAEVKDNMLTLTKEGKSISRRLHPLVPVSVDGNDVVVRGGMNKRVKKNFGTMKAHVKNMISGLTEGFLYRLQVANVHFPMTVEHDDGNKELIVKNFLGEKTDRRIPLVPTVEISIDKDIITVKSEDKEKAGQTAANIEKGTKVRKKDRRIFQDGIFIIEKPGRVFV